MCYPKPGPRCSAHAKERLKTAKKAHKKNPTLKTYMALTEAEEEYSKTPENIRKLAKGDRFDRRKAERLQEKRQAEIDLYKEMEAYKEERAKSPEPRGFQDKMFDTPVKIEDPRPGMNRDHYNEVFQVGENTYVLRGDHRRMNYDENGKPTGRQSGFVQYWLEEKGEMVGFINTLDHGRGEKTDQVIASIESRPGYQGQGITHKLIANAEKISGKPVYTNGHCTPKGYRSLYGKVPILPGEKWEVQYNDMTFVENDECWENGWFRS